VPALALRFYRQAMELKPGFLPAKVGVGRAFLALGLTHDAERMFNEILAEHPEDVGARLGKAAVLGAQGRPKEEIALYRELLGEDPSRSEAQAHLVAALIDLPDWQGARDELSGMLRVTPENARLRYLYGVTLAKTGHQPGAEREWKHARELGLTPEAEEALASHVGGTGSQATRTPRRPSGSVKPRPTPRAGGGAASGSNGRRAKSRKSGTSRAGSAQTRNTPKTRRKPK
jgi:tetratricopeptide (TPR) repeat protein